MFKAVSGVCFDLCGKVNFNYFEINFVMSETHAMFVLWKQQKKNQPLKFRT